MKIRLLESLTISISVALCLAGAASAMTDDWVGDIGKRGIGLTLSVSTGKTAASGNDFEGYYFYNDVMKNLPIERERQDGKSYMYEVNAAGQRVSKFVCSYPAKDPRGHFKGKIDGEVMVGTWSKMDGSNSTPFYLSKQSGVGAEGEKRYAMVGVKDDAAFEKKVQKFRTAVLTGDKKTAASMINFPISCNVSGKSRNIANSAQFIKNFDRIVNPEYKKAMQEAVPHNLFVNDQGVMLGNGQVWFESDGTVKTLNN